jgi:hypothetical protein
MMMGKYRIGPVTKWSMLAVAGVIDGLQALFSIFYGTIGIPIIGLAGPALAIILTMLLSLFALLLFLVWLRIHGVGMLSGKFIKAVILFGGTLFEIMPLLNALPIWTAVIAATIFVSKLEDKKKHASNKMKLAQAV